MNNVNLVGRLSRDPETRNGNTTVSAQSLNNQGGVVQATGASSLGITTTALLDNTANGQIAAGGAATAIGATARKKWWDRSSKPITSRLFPRNMSAARPCWR